MDPVAHTLFGATLAEAGLKRRSHYATATLLIGANLPDIDVMAGLWGPDTELYVRRGHTHGVLAMLVLPVLLTLCVWLWHRWRSARDAHAARGTAGVDGHIARPPPTSTATAPPFRPGALLALAFLAVWSHPLLDFLNTYGVRLLMPFDGRWFYGDTLFIVDPWFWLMAAAGVVLALSATRRAVAGWLALGTAATVLILSTNLVPLAVKVAWCVAIAMLIALRWHRPLWAQSVTLARAGLTGVLLYIGVAYGAGRVAEAAMAGRHPDALQVQANPEPGVPFAQRFVVVEPAAYRIITPDGTVHEVPREQPDAIVQSALDSPSIRGFVNWMRFPYWEVENADDHWIVRIRDLRYQGPDIEQARGIGFVQVPVPKQAEARAAHAPADARDSP